MVKLSTIAVLTLIIHVLWAKSSWIFFWERHCYDVPYVELNSVILYFWRRIDLDQITHVSAAKGIFLRQEGCVIGCSDLQYHVGTYSSCRPLQFYEEHFFKRFNDRFYPGSIRF